MPPAPSSAVKITYELSMPRPETHLYEVVMRVRGAVGPDLLVAMPAWAPGSYMVRDFARHVHDFEVRDASGKALAWERKDKQTWRVRAGSAGDVRIAYRVYANDLSVQTSHLDVTHGYLNGSSVFLYAVGRKDLPAEVTVNPFPGWHVDTGLPRVRGNRYRARDYDHLADCPFEIGTHERFTFKVAGKEHVVAIYGHGNEDGERLVKDLKKIVEEEAAIFRGRGGSLGEALPYDRYVFILHLTDRRRGGLEHENSNTSAVDRFDFQPRKRYADDVLALEAHEFFHTWNVKRIRPAVLGPFDYDKEVHTTLLWAMEGLTSYYDHLVLARAGLISEERYREFLGETITKLRAQPGRLKMSLEESSFLTWIKLYKPDENWPNTGISYYLKGELVGLILDLAIRDRTDGKKSLDDVMYALWTRHGRVASGISEAEGWREVLEDVTGLAWGPFWRKYIRGTAELDFENFLSVVGWRLQAAGGDEKKSDEAKRPGWLGVHLKSSEGRVRVKTVLHDSPAEEAGLAAEDELIALDGFKVRDEDWFKKRLTEAGPGGRVRLTFFKRDELIEREVTLGRPHPEKWKVVEAAKGTARAQRLRKAWLKSRV